MKAFADDLRFAQTADFAVRFRTMSGEEFLAGVNEVHEDEGYVSLYVPEHMGDDTARRKVDLDLIESLTVTDIKWGASDEPKWGASDEPQNSPLGEELHAIGVADHHELLQDR